MRATTVDLTMVVENGDVVPAMPDDFMLHIEKFKENMELFGKKAQLAKQSEAWRKGVNNVPLKPDPRKYEPGPVRTALEANIDGLQNTVPVCITGENIGSNQGFLDVVLREWREHQARNEASGVKKYLVLLADINIFDRLIKVLAHTLNHTTPLSPKHSTSKWSGSCRCVTTLPTVAQNSGKK